MTQPHTMTPIGIVQSPYAEKFAVPRQPGLVPAATATIELLGDSAHPDCVRGLEAFSHIWVLFIFHQTQNHGWKPLVRPPRLGGNEKRGVFATRSTFRPNAIGMSVVKLAGVRQQNGRTYVDVQGADWVNGTPVIDIKPYVPYADAITDAVGGFAPQQPNAQLSTVFTDAAQQQLAALAPQYPDLEVLICQVLAQDPRPAYQRNSSATKEYGMTLYDLNIRWVVVDIHDHQPAMQENRIISIRKGF